MSDQKSQLEIDARRFLANLIGEWTGDTKTWFDPKAVPETGTTHARFRVLLDDLFIQEEYDSFIGEKGHRGSRIFGFDSQANEVSCYFVDSFHTGATALIFKGAFGDERLSVNGQYKAGHETWGWRIEISAMSRNNIRIEQFNIWPSGQVDRAVETILSRKPS